MAGEVHGIRYESLEPGKDLPVPPRLGLELPRECIDTIEIAGAGSHDLYMLEAGEDVPDLVAQWLRYSTFTDQRISALYEGDRWRFADVDAITKRFLRDRDGRRLLMAVDHDERTLSAVTWVHRLAGDLEDYPLYKAARQGLIKRERLLKLAPQNVATVAIREYSSMYHTDIGERIVMLATRNVLAGGAFGVVVRLAANDYTGERLTSPSGGSDLSYTPVDGGPGFVVMLAARPKPKDKKRPQSAEPFHHLTNKV